MDYLNRKMMLLGFFFLFFAPSVLAIELLPATDAQLRTPSVIPGLTEVVAGNNILYVDDTGRYLIVGHIYDLIDDEDITESRRRVLFTPSVGLKLSLLIDEASVKLGQGDPTVTVVTDPACSWCVKLWRESLKGFNQGAVRYAFSSVTDQTVNLLCSTTPNKTINAAFSATPATSKTPAPSALCKRVATGRINKLHTALNNANIIGTPTLIHRDGRIHQGYLNPTDFINWIEGTDHE